MSQKGILNLPPVVSKDDWTLEEQILAAMKTIYEQNPYDPRA